MAAPPVPGPLLPPGTAVNVLGRLAGITRLVVTVQDRLERLDKADAKNEQRIEKLTEQMAALANMVSNLSGQMATIEKRLEDREKLVETRIELEVLKATEKLRAEFSKGAGKPASNS